MVAQQQLFDALKRSEHFREVDEATHYSSPFATLVGTAFASAEMLPRLQLIQRRLDPLDIEGLDALARQETGRSLSDGAADTLSPASSSAQAALARRLLDEEDASEMLTFEDAAAAYLLSAAAKDCSLLCRIMVDEETLPNDIKAVDVDPKSLKKLGHYFDLDRAIWQSARQGLEKEACIDAHASEGTSRKCCEAQLTSNA